MPRHAVLHSLVSQIRETHCRATHCRATPCRATGRIAIRCRRWLAAGLLLLASPLPARSEEPQSLFNGKNLEGWQAVLQDKNVPAEQVWSVQDGVLKCTGRPVGYLRTTGEYSDYKLSLQWRWTPGTEGGNSGVLVHTSSPDELGIWPKSIEVQLGRDNAGDFWVIGTELDVPDEDTRKKGRRHLNLTDDSEKALGQWNQMEIECRGKEIRVWVNGDLVNHATNCSVTRGAICLQSEGAPVEFRSLTLAPLP